MWPCTNAQSLPVHWPCQLPASHGQVLPPLNLYICSWTSFTHWMNVQRMCTLCLTTSTEAYHSDSRENLVWLWVTMQKYKGKYKSKYNFTETAPIPVYLISLESFKGFWGQIWTWAQSCGQLGDLEQSLGSLRLRFPICEGGLLPCDRRPNY